MNIRKITKIRFRINRIDGSEAGEYKCTAENEAGIATAIANLIVQVSILVQLVGVGYGFLFW